jgi:hypothetical protein
MMLLTGIEKKLSLMNLNHLFKKKPSPNIETVFKTTKTTNLLTQNIYANK